MSFSPPEPRRRFAIEVVARLRATGFRALWAGGCVRDLILGNEPADYDVATDAMPEQVKGLFRRTVAVGESFGVVKVLGPPGAGEVEVATFRSDGRYLDGRHPESVTFGNAEDDAARRDFTINGMFLDPISGEVLDFVGGRDDLERGLLRAIGDPEARFDEDKLRLLRAVRFASRFALEIEPATRAALVRMAPQIRVVAAERIGQELRRMLVDPSRARAMALASDLGLVAAILPPLVALMGFPGDDPARPDADLWDHTLRVLDRLPDRPGFPLAFAALLHDVGKPPTREIKDDRPMSSGFERVGRQIAEELGRDLKLSNDERQRIGWLIEHQRDLDEPKALREARLKRILATPGIADLLALQRADALATTGDASHVDYCDWYLRTLPRGPLNPSPLVNGHDLGRHGLKPGPAFKRLLDELYDAQLEGTFSTKEGALQWLDNHLVDAGGPRGSAGSG